MTSNALQVGIDAPFPWPGSKRRVADVVWQALGDVHNYIEPFAGSLAALLRRPAEHTLRAETVSDLDGHIANFWRAVKNRPDDVAQHADYPVSHVDLTARHRWLIDEKPNLVTMLDSDPEWCDPKAAGWWVWGLSQWIGSGWCTDYRRTAVATGREVLSPRPHLGSPSQGVNGRRRGVSDLDQSVPHVWMRGLSRRLRHVRILHCDWTRATSSGCLQHGRHVGVLLDPPYDPGTLADGRVLYGEHSRSVAAECRDWAIRTCADDPRVRVVLCGYEEEHAAHVPSDWRMLSWSSTGMQVSNTGGKSGKTRHKERIWLSPSCLPVDLNGSICRDSAEEQSQPSMFGGAA